MQISHRGLREVCRLLGYTRQAYYQHQQLSTKRSLEEDLVIGQVLIHRTPQPQAGGEKLHEMIRPFMQGHGIKMGRDALYDLLRSNGLLLVKRKRKQPRTTDSRHWMHKYPDLIKGIKLSRADELWVSDITYIHLSQGEFGYLSLITDAYSRKIVGFCMNEDLSAQGSVDALKMALKGRKGCEPLIHHSDRGSQYCSESYVHTLKGIQISMTQNGNPRDNAIAERVNGILKQELLKEVYSSVKQARQDVILAIDIYNTLRLHSSIDMMTPEAAHVKTGAIHNRWKPVFKGAAKKVEPADSNQPVTR